MQRCIIATHSSRVCRGVANTVAMSLPSHPCHSSRNAALLSCVAMTQVCHCVITVVQCCLPVITTAAALPLQQRRCRRCHLAASAAAAATLLLRHQHHLCHGIADWVAALPLSLLCYAAVLCVDNTLLLSRDHSANHIITVAQCCLCVVTIAIVLPPQ
jgi:hypothetical protein